MIPPLFLCFFSFLFAFGFSMSLCLQFASLFIRYFSSPISLYISSIVKWTGDLYLIDLVMYDILGVALVGEKVDLFYLLLF